MRRNDRILKTTLIVSALVHFLLGLAVAPSLLNHPDPFSNAITVDLTQLDLPDPVKSADPAPSAEAPLPQDSFRPPPTLDINGQLVELAKPEKQEMPEQADYLSQYNTRVDEETKSRRFKINPRVLAERYSDKVAEGTSDALEINMVEEAAVPEVPAVQSPPPPPEQVASLQPGRTDPEVAKDPLHEMEKIKSPKKLPPEEPVNGPIFPIPRTEEDAQAEESDKKMESTQIVGKGGDTKTLNLYPDRYARWAYIDRPGQPGQAPTATSQRSGRRGAPQNDYLQEKAGDATLLNSREFLYADYFNKIRRMVNFWWSQNLDNVGPGDMNQPINKPSYRTAVQPVLDQEGHLVSVALLKTCGVTAFDKAVLEAWKSAAPFPRPPDALVQDGQAQLIRFDFVLEITTGESRYSAIDPRANVRFPGIAWPR